MAENSNQQSPSSSSSMAPAPTDREKAIYRSILNDTTRFQRLVVDLTSPIHQQNPDAMLIYWCMNWPDDFSLKLVHLLCSSSDSTAWEAAASIFLKLITVDSPAFIWHQLKVSTQNLVKNALLDCVRSKKVESVRDLVCQLAFLSGIKIDGGWPELIPSLFDCMEGLDKDDWWSRSRVLVIFAGLAKAEGAALVPHLDRFHSILSCSLTDESLGVRFPALNIAIYFVLCLEEQRDRDRFMELLSSMICTLIDALNHLNVKPEDIEKALEMFIRLVQTEPMLSRKQLVCVLSAMMQIAVVEEFGEGVRHLALKFIITLSEAGETIAGMMRELQRFIHLLFPILLKVLLDIKEDSNWQDAGNGKEDENYQDISSHHRFGQDCLYGLSMSLGGDRMIPVALELLPAYLAAPQWKKRYAALICLEQIAKGCSKAMTNYIDELVSMVLQSFEAPDPRVRCAAQNVIRKLLAGLDEEAFISYLDSLVHKLLPLLKNEEKMIQKQALIAFASIAETHQELFQKHSDSVLSDGSSHCINCVTTEHAFEASYRRQLACESVERAIGHPLVEFERLLQCVTPVIASPSSRKACETCSSNQRHSHSVCRSPIPCTSLQTVWNWYEESTSFGMKVRVQDSRYQEASPAGHASFDAHFVPSLSAVQLFGHKKLSPCCSESEDNAVVRVQENKDAALQSSALQTSSSKPSSISSSPTDVNSDAAFNSVEQTVGPSNAPHIHRCDVIDRSFPPTSDDMKLMFEYFESEKPRDRRALHDKVSQLARPAENSWNRGFGDASKMQCATLCELHPASWFSVAWYPIYSINIPKGKLDAAFLTYHSLGHSVHRCVATDTDDKDILFPVIGLQSNHAQDELWFNPKLKIGERAAFEALASQLVKDRIMTLEENASFFARGLVDKGYGRVANYQHDFLFFKSGK